MATSCWSLGSCLRLDDLDAGLPETHHGWPRLHAPRIEDPGLRIGALVDPDCTLLRLVANPRADRAGSA